MNDDPECHVPSAKPNFSFQFQCSGIYYTRTTEIVNYYDTLNQFSFLVSKIALI